MPNLSPQLFDNALRYLNKQQTKMHHRYVIRSVNAETGSQARLVIDKLINDGLISKDYQDYYKITPMGRDVADDAGGYRNFSDAMKYHGTDIQPIDYLTAKRNNPNAIGYTSEPLPFGGLYPNTKPISVKYAEEIKARSGYIEALERVAGEPIIFPIAPDVKVSRWKKIIGGVSKFLQHWFVEKYLKLIIMALLTLLLGYFGKLYLEEHFPK